eukprot:CAMPEP_0173317194 /NCGR_PEP_ID=MMETSP1143-20121109/26945_1 /TAXON_ID=483371 /ORGANISM="non described non described, Strain CCMP2298" /LENGTH=49 /DNA_ID= /DNA_START= /DNA_END= /DNA_ORIENTATION=
MAQAQVGFQMEHVAWNIHEDEPRHGAVEAGSEGQGQHHQLGVIALAESH